MLATGVIMFAVLNKFIRKVWRSLLAIASLVGVLSLPDDISNLPVALGIPHGSFRETLEAITSVHRETWLTAFSILLLSWLIWVDLRPLISRWWATRRTPAFSISDHIHIECHPISGVPGIYLHKYYLCVGNNFHDGRTLKRVQARLFGYTTPILCHIKGHAVPDVDLRHGEWVFFEIGRMASKDIARVSSTVELDKNLTTAYQHNVSNGYLSFELWSFPNKQELGLSGGSLDGKAGKKSIWTIGLVISADDVKSENFTVSIDFTGEKPSVTCVRAT